jgi:hypothetical protein
MAYAAGLREADIGHDQRSLPSELFQQQIGSHGDVAIVECGNVATLL